jgi:prophage regulatory protein
MKPQLQIIRKPKVLEKSSFSKSTFHTRLKQGLFVPPISLGERAVGWISSEVDTCLAAMAMGKSNDEIKALVIELVEQRQNLMECLK